MYVLSYVVEAFSQLLLIGITSWLVSRQIRLVRIVLLNLQTFSYDLFKRYLLSNPVPIIDYQFHDNLLCHVAASVLEGTVATSTQSYLKIQYPLTINVAICAPADVMRSRLMSAVSIFPTFSFMVFTCRNSREMSVLWLS